MEPRFFLALNPLALIGTTDPSIPEIPEDAIEALNDMIESVWGENNEVAIPILTQGRGLSNSERGLVRPVQGLRVLTRQVASFPKGDAEEAILSVKTEYKNQDVMECIESGRSLVKLTLLGRLVTNPKKPALRLDEAERYLDDNQHKHSQRRRDHKERRDGSHRKTRRPSSPVNSVYSDKERSTSNVLGRLRRALGA
jgi:hypothetical protein